MNPEDLYVYRAMAALELWEQGRLSDETMLGEVAAFWAADADWDATQSHNEEAS